MNRFLLLKIFSFALLFCLIALILVDYFPQNTSALVPLDSNTCGYSQDLVGKLGLTLNGTGLAKTDPNQTSYQGSFNVSVPSSGTPQKAYLYWTEKYSSIEPRIRLRINNGSNLNLTATTSPNGIFGPARLNSVNTSYTGYIVDITQYINNGQSWRINSGNNNFRVTKNLDGSTDASKYDLFGAGVVIIYEDPNLPEQHLELKCGFDVTFENKTTIDTAAKWGKWSNVACHQFDPATGNRQIKYYAFMSGTKQKDASNYRPNAFWYHTGDGNGNIPGNIKNLNRPPNQFNLGLNTIPGSIEYSDAFDANNGNEWDTFNSETESGLTINIPTGNDYICFQTESRNVNPAGLYGLGSSMQWSMSALTFAYSGPTLTPSPTVNASITPTVTATPTPTPVAFYPWVASVGGNVYSKSFEQTSLNKINQANGNKIAYSYKDVSEIADFNNLPAFLSQDLFIQNSNSGIPARSSRNSFQLNSYTDNNAQYSSSLTWYEYFEQYLLNIADDLVKIQNANTSAIKVSDIVQIPATASPDDVLLFVLGHTNFDIRVCDRKAIFLIEGDLVLNPNLVVSGVENGCTFIVSGTTTITEGGDAGSSDSPIKTVYDQTHGYFITNNFVTQPDSRRDGLQIVGGVVTNSTSFNRTLNSQRNEYSPAEIITYDPRYLYIYGDLFKYSYGYNIRESQFIRSIE